ncbi:MAG TPA: transcription-repair coupling factor [Candidatus Omnitrophota bacterium]|nr:transcription-repair coupling factor [Candidatus Omnitrophota bacterium]
MLDLVKQIPKDIFSGLIGAAKSCVLGNLSPDLIITATYEGAARLKSEIELLTDKKCLVLPPLDIIPGEEISPTKEVVGERMGIIARWSAGERPLVAAPLRAVITKTCAKVRTLRIAKGETIDRDRLIRDLIGMDYKRTEIVGECGEFSVRGGIIDIFSSGLSSPARLEIAYDKVASLRAFDPNSQRSIVDIGSLEILPVAEAFETALFSHLPPNAKIVIDEPLAVAQARDKVYKEFSEFRSGGKFIEYEEILKLKPAEMTAFSTPDEPRVFSTPPQYFGRLEDLARDLPALAGKKVFIVSKHSARLKEFIPDPVIAGELSGGFVFGDMVLLTDYEIFGETVRFAKPKKAAKEGIDEALLADLKEGDFVVHEEYGVGIYRGLRRLPEVEGEHMLIEYANGDKLDVPLTMLGMIEKFSAGEGAKPKLSHLGGGDWQRTKSRVKKSIRDMTKELLDLYAGRRQAEKNPFPSDDVWQKELEATFPYEETPDQLRAIGDVKRDMESEKPMDRLICGDVGYGKTEVALRAAAKAAAAGKQVAVLVPTTILAEQHYNNFKERFKTLPFSIEMLSRFRSREEQKAVLAGAAAGSVDIVIGTHRLISKDVKFRDLGLLIVDEEQRFGVAHKERLKQLRRSVDVITLSATPIPRTLYFSLSGARDMSQISTPPLDRSPVRTYVLAWNEAVVREAIEKELDRGGQVYYVFNRVEKIEAMAAKLKKIVPNARIGIGHGQMKEKELEAAMVGFLKREYDLLLCSTIIESGIDIQSANTIIIDNADRFGLAQLYQLRGRVGRSTVRAYSYLFYHPDLVPTETAVERLKAIQEYTALGSGYKLAMRDLEIRGAGNLLGAEQHGHMLAVGFDLYCELLEEAVREIKGIPEPTPRQVEIDIKEDAYIPSGYIADERQRIAVYRRLNLLERADDLKNVREELRDRFGEAPKPLLNLMDIIEIKVRAIAAGARSIKEKAGMVRIEYQDGGSRNFRKTNLAEIKARVAR